MDGKPLIYYQIQNALKSKYITDIVVTSDDEDIIEYSSNFPVYLRRRPPKLALDNVPLDPVIWDAIMYMKTVLNKVYDIVVTLQPTSPLLKVTTLDSAIEKFVSENLDTLISVVDATHLYWVKNNGQIIPDYAERLNRQSLPKRYRETGAFLITKRKFITENSRFGKKIGIFILDEEEGLDIDTALDWFIAETLIHKLKVLFVVNGNEKVGMGHIYRTLTLADRLIGHKVIFLTYESDEQAINLIEDMGYQVIIVSKHNLLKKIAEIKPDIVINDILDTPLGYIKKLKELGVFIANFEDLGEGADEAHLVFNALYEKTDPKPHHRFGYKYECLNEKFYLYTTIEFREPPETLFVSFGGIDQNNLTRRVLELVPKIVEETPIKKVITVIGPGYSHKKALATLLNKLKEWKNHIEVYQNVKNMPGLMKRADIAITSNGRTIYELSAMGIPTISIAQNDRETFHLFARYHKGIKYLGIACTVCNEEILNAIKMIANNSFLRKKMYLSQIEASQIIKQGVNKVINEISSEYWGWKNERNQTY